MQFYTNDILHPATQTQGFLYGKQALYVSSHTLRRPPPHHFSFILRKDLTKLPSLTSSLNPLALALQVASITPVHRHAWLALVLLQLIYVSTDDTRLAFKGCFHFSFKNALCIFCFSNLEKLNSCFWIEDTRVSVSALS